MLRFLGVSRERGGEGAGAEFHGRVRLVRLFCLLFVAVFF